MRRASFLRATEQLGFSYEDDSQVPLSEGSDSCDSENANDPFNTSNEGEIDEQLSDIDVFEEQNELMSSESESDDEANTTSFPNLYEANGIQYSTQPLLPRLQRRNILTQQQAVLANPQSPEEAFLLFYSEDMLRITLRETNRKAVALRRQCHLSVTSVTKNFSFDELQAHYGIIVRAGLDRDNFTSVDRLWNPSDS